MDTEVARSRAGATSAGLVPEQVRMEHLGAQGDARDHDRMVESLRVTRATKDRDRIYPRAGAGDVSERKGRHQLAGDEARLPLSRTQAGLQQRTRRAALDRMPRTEHLATHRLITDEQEWGRINERLGERIRDGAPLSAGDARMVGRVDRAIRRFEQHNDRTHRVYVAMHLDPDLADNLDDHLAEGDEFTLDRFTAADHNPGAVDPDCPTLLEITGQRGMYLGGSEPSQGTGHLLPRGIRLHVDGVVDADVVGGKAITRRRIIQAHILQEEQ